MRAWIAALCLATLAAACGKEATPVPTFASEVVACQGNLRDVYAGLLDYAVREKSLPRASGHLFYESLVRGGIWPDSAESRARFSCSGGAYAGRDQAHFPLERITGQEPLLACANEHGMSHGDAMNVLYGDGSVRTFVLPDLIARGRVPAGTTTLVLGLDSPLEELRKLTR
jgi:prepilin-type processing-associated H-X9-DG protein